MPTQTREGGNYWITGKGLETVCKWAQLGLTDEEIADNIGVTVSTYRKWKKKFSEFGEAVEKSYATPDLELEKSMFDLATGKAYIVEIKTILDKDGKILKVEKTKKQVPPNPSLQMFLAKSRMPKRYKANFSDTDDDFDVL